MNHTSLIQKIKYMSYAIIPGYWKKHYSKKSLVSTSMNGIYIEWWDYKTNLGDFLGTVITKYLLENKYGKVEESNRGGITKTSVYRRFYLGLCSL